MVHNSKLHGLNTMHTAGIYSDMTVDGPKIGTLVVIIDRAKNLPDRKTIGKQNPYCAARLGKDAKKTETDHRGGQTPKWDQELRFTVHDSPDYYQLKVAVFNEDRKTELIGETWIDLKGVIISGGGQNDIWHGLNYKGKYAGEIRVEITYYDTRSQKEWDENGSHDLKIIRSIPFLDEVEREPRHKCREALRLEPIPIRPMVGGKISGDSSGFDNLKYVSSPDTTHDHKESIKRHDRSHNLANFDRSDQSCRTYLHIPKSRSENKRTDLRSLPTTSSTDFSDHTQIDPRMGYRISDSRSPKLSATTPYYSGKAYVPCSNGNSTINKKVGDVLSKPNMLKPTSRSWLRENDSSENREGRACHSVSKESTVRRDQKMSPNVQYKIPYNIPPIKAYGAAVDPKEPPPPPPVHRNLNIIREHISQSLCTGQCSNKNTSSDNNPRCKNLVADDQQHLLRSYNKLHKSY